MGGNVSSLVLPTRIPIEADMTGDRLHPCRMRRRRQFPCGESIRIYDSSLLYAPRRLGHPRLFVLLLGLHATQVQVDAVVGA